jgi:hypothetical protein
MEQVPVRLLSRSIPDTIPNTNAKVPLMMS